MYHSFQAIIITTQLHIDTIKLEVITFLLLQVIQDLFLEQTQKLR